MRVVIIGAGLTGLTLAAALGRSGITCEVYERATEFTHIGAGIQLAPNAVRLLRDLGLDPAAAAGAVRSNGVEVRHWRDGDVASWMPLGDDCEQLFGAPYYLMHRADLHRALVDLAPAGAVQRGRTCVEVAEQDHGAQVALADGCRITADVVVGADGVGSMVRSLRTTSRPSYSGQTVYRGLIPSSRSPFVPDEPKSVMWVGEKRHFICYPVAGGELINIVAVTADEQWAPESWSMPADVQEAQAAFAGWDASVRELIGAADPLTKWGLHVHDSDFSWSGRFVTVAGDAAHPMLPFLAQGANQGIEDAVTLASCLTRVPVDGIPSALARYEQLRRPRVVAIQHHSARPPAPQGRQTLLDLAWIFGHDPLAGARHG